MTRKWKEAGKNQRYQYREECLEKWWKRNEFSWDSLTAWPVHLLYIFSCRRFSRNLVLSLLQSAILWLIIIAFFYELEFFSFCYFTNDSVIDLFFPRDTFIHFLFLPFPFLPNLFSLLYCVYKLSTLCVMLPYEFHGFLLIILHDLPWSK